MREFLILGSLALATACTTSLGTMTPARTTPTGHVRGSIGAGANVPITRILDAIDEASTAADNLDSGTGSITDVTTLVDTATDLLLTPPAPDVQAQLRVGVAPKTDFGLRVATGALRLDGRYMFLGDEKSKFGASLGVGFEFFAFQRDMPVPSDIDEYLQLKAPQWFAFDIPILFGVSGSVGHFWVGPKLVVTRHSSSAVVTVDDFEDQRISVTSTNVFVAGQLGFAVGYEVLWFTMELTAAWAKVNGSVTVNGVANDRSYGTLILTPIIGFLFEF